MSAQPRWAIVSAVLAVGCGSSDAAKAPSLSLSRLFSSSPAPEPVASSSVPPPSATVASASEQELLPRVSLEGATRQRVNVPPDAVPAYARVARAWVYERPNADARHLGYLRAGDEVAVGRAVEGNAGCPGGWHALLSRGYVCAGSSTTLDASDPVVRALGAYPAEAAR